MALAGDLSEGDMGGRLDADCLGHVHKMVYGF
jgi:hypothetical protein